MKDQIKGWVIFLVLIIFLTSLGMVYAQDNEVDYMQRVQSLRGAELTAFANYLVTLVDNENTRNLEVYEALIYFYYQKRIYNSVIRYGIKSLNIGRNPGIAYYMARVFHLHTGEFRKAIRAYEIVNQSRSTGTHLPEVGSRDEIYYYMGLCYSELEYYHLAEASFIAAILIAEEENIYYFSHLAHIYTELKEWQEAKRAIQKALEIDEDCQECQIMLEQIENELEAETENNISGMPAPDLSLNGELSSFHKELDEKSTDALPRNPTPVPTFTPPTPPMTPVPPNPTPIPAPEENQAGV